VRKVLPGNRRALPPEINMHSVKNRFLMRIKNISPDLYRRNWFSITTRDIMVVMCCLLWEHTSLKAFWFLARNWKRVMAKRAEIQAASAWTTSTWRAGSSTRRSANRRPRRWPACFRAPKPRRRSPALFAMRIALLGTRGIPANYGGFETFAEELSTRWQRAAIR
jgi:hypothetical protein